MIASSDVSTMFVDSCFCDSSSCVCGRLTPLSEFRAAGNVVSMTTFSESAKMILRSSGKSNPSGLRKIGSA